MNQLAFDDFDWPVLIAERDEWVQRNFPGSGPDDDGWTDTIIGCAEEFGELCHAHLKEKQGIRGTPEEHQENARDAIGDIFVYLLGVISRKVHPDNIFPHGARRDSAESALFYLGGEIGSLMRMGEYGDSDDEWTFRVNRILYYLYSYCTHRGWVVEEIAMDTWNKVKARDWNAHRDQGANKLDPKMA